MQEDPDLVLVVDDDQHALRVEVQLLTAAGHATRSAQSVDEALEAVRDRPPDLVVLDLHLGAEDGLDVVRRLRGDPATSGIPVLAVSAATDPEDVERAGAAGCDSFLGKPFLPRTFLDRVETGLEGGRGRP
jgi:CheY-like chemotaxis protein